MLYFIEWYRGSDVGSGSEGQGDPPIKICDEKCEFVYVNLPSDKIPPSKI